MSRGQKYRMTGIEGCGWGSCGIIEARTTLPGTPRLGPYRHGGT